MLISRWTTAPEVEEDPRNQQKIDLITAPNDCYNYETNFHCFK